ncbi:hypothetical protein GLAREA_03654 [Glarea lozoyensis ATCC 20868]|uniref:Uncharacterized protein n=1 Tax=Glarea lozoyensis (strain ATCC 20868 / MF5171) TaxID=1116229 RepID=S3CWC9_GLAL2|nr:uncharacterized protein GLAREA_03654 [Glarea lozoyensis ATCC 20868]EPE30687.1 hypothetical protein GLAREA_03654 [Glarea lozoyensis ATCC 20868]
MDNSNPTVTASAAEGAEVTSIVRGLGASHSQLQSQMLLGYNPDLDGFGETMGPDNQTHQSQSIDNASSTKDWYDKFEGLAHDFGHAYLSRKQRNIARKFSRKTFLYTRNIRRGKLISEDGLTKEQRWAKLMVAPESSFTANTETQTQEQRPTSPTIVSWACDICDPPLRVKINRPGEASRCPRGCQRPPHRQLTSETRDKIYPPAPGSWRPISPIAPRRKTSEKVPLESDLASDLSMAIKLPLPIQTRQEVAKLEEESTSERPVDQNVCTVNSKAKSDELPVLDEHKAENRAQTDGEPAVVPPAIQGAAKITFSLTVPEKPRQKRTLSSPSALASYFGPPRKKLDTRTSSDKLADASVPILVRNTSTGYPSICSDSIRSSDCYMTNAVKTETNATKTETNAVKTETNACSPSRQPWFQSSRAQQGGEERRPSVLRRCSDFARRLFRKERRESGVDVAMDVPMDNDIPVFESRPESPPPPTTLPEVPTTEVVDQLREALVKVETLQPPLRCTQPSVVHSSTTQTPGSMTLPETTRAGERTGKPRVWRKILGRKEKV